MKHPLPPRLASSRINIAVAGCGGNGSQILSGLARLHCALLAVGHPGLEVTAYDPDLVTEANVGRQLFSPADLGQFKAHVLINQLNLYYDLDWAAKPVRFARANVSHRADVLIGCVDSIAARKSITRQREVAHYWLDLGNTDKKGQVILGELYHVKPAPADEVEPNGVKRVDQKKLPHFFDLFPELLKKNVKEDDSPSCSLAEALERQDLFINQTVATFALQLLWQFIRQGGLDLHGYFINLETGKVTPLPIK